MKRNLLMLCALICFLSPHVWADTATTSPPVKSQTDEVSSIQKPATSVRGVEPSKTIDVSKGDVKNPSEQSNKYAEKTKCSGWFVFFSMFPAILFLVFLLVVKKILQNNNWSLGDALSESEPLKDQNGAVVNDANGKPVFARSASRFMAFIGFFAIIVWIVGLSIPTLYRFACTGEVPDLSKVSTFLLAQAGIFAPYIANKLAAAIKS